MPTPDEIVALYQRQSHRRFQWFVISVAVGLVAAVSWKLSGLIHEVWRARRELLERRREGR
ncbi:MAG: hypothetical protein M0R80_26500 [Proteobacteria bacterium]|jgi:hypothetical protein|nr:hypothetical protein [Pseudomonadota bacterium]